jgi:hypothetical protein
VLQCPVVVHVVGALPTTKHQLAQERTQSAPAGRPCSPVCWRVRATLQLAKRLPILMDSSPFDVGHIQAIGQTTIWPFAPAIHVQMRTPTSASALLQAPSDLLVLVCDHVIPLIDVNTLQAADFTPYWCHVTLLLAARIAEGILRSSVGDT